MPKLVSMPPQDNRSRDFAERLRTAIPQIEIVIAETEDEARRELPDADATYGWIPPDLLPLAHNVRWLQAKMAAPLAGFYYYDLIAHPLVVTNIRGIFDDHIGQHIMMFVLALACGLPYYMDAQRERRWDPDARQAWLYRSTPSERPHRRCGRNRP